MVIPDHLTWLQRNLYAGQEATVGTEHGITYWFQIKKGVHQGCIFSPCLFNLICRVHPEKAMAPHSSTLAWKIPWMEEPGRLQSMGSQRVGHDWATSLSLFTFIHWRRKWQPTPVFLPEESQGQGAWWADVYGVAQSRTWLEWLSSSSSKMQRCVINRIHHVQRQSRWDLGRLVCLHCSFLNFPSAQCLKFHH